MNPRLFLLGLFGLASSIARSPAADMIEIEARFVKATPAEIRKAIFGSDSRDNHKEAIHESFVQLVEENPSEPPSQTPSPLHVIGTLNTKEGEPFPKELLEKVISNSRIVTLNKERAKVENVREMRYPSEYSNPAGENESPAPTAFETRNVGITVEFEPALGPDGQIDLVVNPQIVTFQGFIDYSGVKPGEQVTGDTMPELLKKPLKGGGVWQPVFQIRALSTQVTLHSGNTLLLGESLGDGDGRADPNAVRTYVFITARKLPAK